MRRHELKILPKWYENVESNKKNFEIRRNDRDFKVGNTLVLQEYEEGSYTGRQITRKIQYIYQGNGDYGLSEGYCILGLEREPKTGHWIYTDYHTWCCSECGGNPHRGTGFVPNKDGMKMRWKYCNLCGAKMIEAKGE